MNSEHLFEEHLSRWKETNINQRGLVDNITCAVCRVWSPSIIWVPRKSRTTKISHFRHWGRGVQKNLRGKIKDAVQMLYHWAPNKYSVRMKTEPLDFPCWLCGKRYLYRIWKNHKEGKEREVWGVNTKQWATCTVLHCWVGKMTEWRRTVQKQRKGTKSFET